MEAKVSRWKSKLQVSGEVERHSLLKLEFKVVERRLKKEKWLELEKNSIEEEKTMWWQRWKRRRN